MNLENSFDKAPPQSIDAEELVLGGIIVESRVFTSVSFLKPEMFYSEIHQAIFEAISAMFYEGAGIDLLTVVKRLKTLNSSLNWAVELSQLTARVGSNLGIVEHARMIVGDYIARSGIRISNEINLKLFSNESPVETISNTINDLSELINETSQSENKPMSLIARENMDILNSIDSGEVDMIGVKTYINKIDEKLLGFQKSDLIILAARPGQGKTALMLSLVKNMAKHSIPTAVFSLEMDSQQLGFRFLCMETGIDYRTMRSRFKTDHQREMIHSASSRVETYPTFINDQPAINMVEIKAKAIELKRQHDIQMIFIDYIQLIKPRDVRVNREVQITEISRGLKVMAKELKLPVMALSQLNRDVEKRGGDKRPKLSDLRESGSIEQDADIVTFIYRPYESGIKFTEDGSPIDEELAELMVEKHRNGDTGDIPLRFIDHAMIFTDYAETSEFDPDDNNFPF